MVCKICCSPTEAFSHPKTKVLYHQCHHCDFIFVDDAFFITTEEELVIYNYHNNSLEDEKYVAYLKDFVDHTVIPFRTGNQVLDYGSGPTPVLATILETDYQFDVDIYDLYYAPNKVYQGKMYDIITSTEVIEHLPNPIETLALMYRLLNEGGIVALMTLFHPQDQTIFLDWWYIRDRSHIAFYTPKTIKILAEKIGFQVIYCDDYRQITLKKS